MIGNRRERKWHDPKIMPFLKTVILSNAALSGGVFLLLYDQSAWTISAKSSRKMATV